MVLTYGARWARWALFDPCLERLQDVDVDVDVACGKAGFAGYQRPFHYCLAPQSRYPQKPCRRQRPRLPEAAQE